MSRTPGGAWVDGVWAASTRSERCHSYPSGSRRTRPAVMEAPLGPGGASHLRGRRATATSRAGPRPGAAEVWLSAGVRAAVVDGQLGGNALAQGVEMAHQLRQGASGAHPRGLAAGRLKQGKNLKLLGVVQSLGSTYSGAITDGIRSKPPISKISTIFRVRASASVTVPPTLRAARSYRAALGHLGRL